MSPNTKRTRVSAGWIISASHYVQVFPVYHSLSPTATTPTARSMCCWLVTDSVAEWSDFHKAPVCEVQWDDTVTHTSKDTCTWFHISPPKLLKCLKPGFACLLVSYQTRSPRLHLIHLDVERYICDFGKHLIRRRASTNHIRFTKT